MPISKENNILSIDTETALVGGCHQISLGKLSASERKKAPLPIHVNYLLPSGINKPAKGFATANGRISARCYVSEPGIWKWEAKAGVGKAASFGEFEAFESKLPGKLEISRADNRQFTYASGESFLHFGDTAYTLLTSEGDSWKAYIDQAAQAGFTKIKVWLPQSEADTSNFYDTLRKELNLAFWDKAEKRLAYALTRHPQIQFQVNLFAEDRAELDRYEEGDPLTHLAVLYILERFGSLPNVHWTLASEIDPLKDNAITLQAISRLGKATIEQAPWYALATCGQPRYSTFFFDQERWCSMTSLGSLGQVTGQIAQEQRPLTAKPIVLDEDRAEHTLAPLRPRYYFRRLFWGMLLSGAHPTYEGLDTKNNATGHKSGIHGYYDAGHASRLQAGAHDILHIRKFFKKLDVNLTGWVPEDSICGNKPLLAKSIRSQNSDQCIVYIGNPDAHEAHTGSKGEGFYSDQNAVANTIFTTISMELPFGNGTARWYCPSTGEWHGEVAITKSSCTFLTPEPGDWVLWIQRD